MNVFVSHPSTLLTDNRPHGDGLVAYGFIAGLARRGHRVHTAVASSALRSTPPDGVVLHQLRSRPGRRLIPRISYALEVRRLFRRLQREERFDVVHQLNPVVTGLSVGLARAGAPIVLGPFVGEWEGDAAKRRGGLRSTTRIAFKAATLGVQQRVADALLLSTPAARSKLHRPERVEERLHILPHGIDTATFSPGPRGNGPPSVLYLGRVVSGKGIFTLLEAFERVAAVIPDARLEVAGDGPDLLEAKQVAGRLACASRVHFSGKVQRDEVAAYLRGCTVYCLPSYGEPFGMSALEALSCGRPVVATNTGGLAHLVDEDGGRKVSPGSAEALGDALVEILASTQLQESMGAHNRRRALGEYDWDVVIERLEAIYERVGVDASRT